jgi:3-hydroxyphenylacetate 6-hydroxylase
MAIAAALSTLQARALESPVRALAVAAVIAPLLYIIINEFIRASARVQGMKGPRGLPLIGNLAQIRTNAAEQYRLWSKKYGAVYQIQLGNIPVVVVNSAAAAKVLFGQNAQALSSRPEFYTFHKVRPLV